MITSFLLHPIIKYVLIPIILTVGLYGKGYLDGRDYEGRKVAAEMQREMARREQIFREELEKTNAQLETLQSEKDKLDKELKDAIEEANRGSDRDDVGLNSGVVRRLNRIR